jgi:hypothetical protein
MASNAADMEVVKEEISNPENDEPKPVANHTTATTTDSLKVEEACDLKQIAVEDKETPMDSAGTTEVAAASNKFSTDENVSHEEESTNQSAAAADPTADNMDNNNEESKATPVAPVDFSESALDNTNKKLTVHNVLKFLNNKTAEKMTNGWLEALQKDHPSIAYKRVKKPPKQNWVEITMATEESVELLLDYINSNRLTNKKGGLIYATRTRTTEEKDKRKLDTGDDRDNNKKQRRNDQDDLEPRPPRYIRDVITPLWKQSYEAQLKTKTSEMVKKSTMKIVAEVKGRFKTIQREAKRNKFRTQVKEYEWLKQKRPIEVLEIIPAPSLLRNKSEFTFGHKCASELKQNEDGTEPKPIPAVGFMASGWSGGVSLPHECQNIPSEACAIVDIANEFLLTSPMPPYDSKTHRGFWRFLTARTSRRTGQCMIVVVHAPPTGGAGAKDETDDYSSVFEPEKERLVSMLTEKQLKLKVPRELPPVENFESRDPKDEEDSPVFVTSIFFQEYDGLSNPKPEHPVQVSSIQACLQAHGPWLAQIPNAYRLVSFSCAFSTSLANYACKRYWGNAPFRSLLELFSRSSQQARKTSTQ